MRHPRGATLLELLIVSTILGVVAALGVPHLLPTIVKVRHHAAALQVAAFVDGARRRAVAEGRCYRVRKVGDALQTERRASGDCVDVARDAARADAWTKVSSISPEAGIIFVVADQSTTVPDGLTPAQAADFRLVFRPNGRLRGDGDLDVTDDAARVLVLATALPDQLRAVNVEPIGRICARTATSMSMPQSPRCS